MVSAEAAPGAASVLPPGAATKPRRSKLRHELASEPRLWPRSFRKFWRALIRLARASSSRGRAALRSFVLNGDQPPSQEVKVPLERLRMEADDRQIHARRCVPAGRGSSD